MINRDHDGHHRLGKQMKPEKFQELLDEIEEFIGGHNLSNPHYLFDEDIIKAFPHYKKKQIKRALEELR